MEVSALYAPMDIGLKGVLKHHHDYYLHFALSTKSSAS